MKKSIKDIKYLYYIEKRNGDADWDGDRLEVYRDLMELHQAWNLFCHCRSGEECLCSDRTVRKKYLNWKRVKALWWDGRYKIGRLKVHISI